MLPNLQEAHAENKHKFNLLAYRNRHGQHHGNRQAEDDEVGDNVEIRQGPPDRPWMTVALEARIPHFGERDAHGEVHACRPDVVDEDDAERHVRRLAAVVVLKDAQVEEEDSHLGEPEAEVVE